MKQLKIALLDMNKNHANQGMRNIKEISEQFKKNSREDVSITIFDVRYKDEMPELKDFDIFISSGGPGNPEKEGFTWEQKFTDFLDEIWEHNKTSEVKKFAFLISHSFQLASMHWNLGNICKRKSHAFGVMSTHKTEDGEKDFLLKNLSEPFYAVDSRSYQLIQPNHEMLDKLGMKIVALEKIRPHVDLERAVMAIRFSDEIFGTQFHPEADPKGMHASLKIERNRMAMIGDNGVEKYLETLEQLNDLDKITLTQSEILPRFLKQAADEIMKSAVLA